MSLNTRIRTIKLKKDIYFEEFKELKMGHREMGHREMGHRDRYLVPITIINSNILS